MPDHEEAVREAREAVREAREAVREARAKYAALVEAAGELADAIPESCECIEAYRARKLIDPQCRYHEVSPEVDDLRAALAALQSKEGNAV